MEITQIVLQFSTLGGCAAMIAALINLLKWLSLIKDGEAPQYSAAFNLIALGIFITLNLVRIPIDFARLDAQAAAIANVMMLILSYIMQLGVSKLSHFVLRDTPIFGSRAKNLKCASAQR